MVKVFCGSNVGIIATCTLFSGYTFLILLYYYILCSYPQTACRLSSYYTDENQRSILYEWMCLVSILTSICKQDAPRHLAFSSMRLLYIIYIVIYFYFIRWWTKYAHRSPFLSFFNTLIHILVFGIFKHT